MITPDGRDIPVRARMDIGTREDGRVEQFCKHGIGHPIGHIFLWQEWMGVHGCDACCDKPEFRW